MPLIKQEDDGGVWVSGSLAAAIITVIFGFFVVIYQFQNDKLWADGNDITQLKSSIVVMNNANIRNETAISAIDQTLTSILISIQESKGSIDALKDQVHDLQKQVSGLDDVLRPSRPMSVNPQH